MALPRIASIVLAACLLFGCGSEISLRAPDVDLRKVQVVFMPSMVALYRIEGCDLPFDDWRSKLGRAKVDGWLHYYAPKARARVADVREVAGTEVRVDAFYEMMDNLSRAMFADRGSRPLGAWTLGPRLANWAAPLKADYVVFIVVRGSIWGSDRSGCRGDFLLPVLRAGLVVVELGSGRIVRFRATELGDIETPHIAAGVGKLMGALD